MESYILDTNIFFNMEEGLNLGEKTEDVVTYLTKTANELKKDKRALFYMPPRIVEEFLSFFEDKEQPFLKTFLGSIHIQSPNLSSLSYSATVFYELIEDIRERSYRGLRIGEEEIEKAAILMQGKKDLSKKDFQISIGQVVKKFRERYRQATRVGFLDSVGDLDIIMLAKEIDGVLVSTDMGLLSWGRKFGVKEMPAAVFGAKMRGG